MSVKSQKKKREKRQRFLQLVKCPCCHAEIVFEWEAVGSTTVQEESTKEP